MVFLYRSQSDLEGYRLSAGIYDIQSGSVLDKMQIIVITLGPNGTESEDPLIRFLSLRLSNDLPLETRKSKLADEYKIQMDDKLGEEMKVMCNLGEGIARRNYAMGKAEGREEGRAKGRAEGRAEGEDKLEALLSKLYEEGRPDDARRAVKDRAYRKEQYIAFSIV
ncbi:MAG: hypothetical protein IJ083_17090 [Clostridia bacterium]|nr:hypothetical protein [Clostridia bacterium]